MEYYTEQGKSYEDCYLRISERFNNKPFKIIQHRKIERKGGFLGLFTIPGVEVDYYFTPMYRKPAAAQANEENLETAKQKLIAAAGKNLTAAEIRGKEEAEKILSALNEIKEKIENGAGGFSSEHPSFVKTAEILRANDFSQSYIKSFLERMKKELTHDNLNDFESLEDTIVEWIGESISIYKEEEFARKPRIFILIGPTGIGKTTTIAKLAAFYGIGTEEIPAIDVRMITIDAFRIGAKEQLEKIGDIMQIPVTCVDNKQALRREIAIHKEIDMFLIDTIGKSPKDAAKLGEMKEILDGAGRDAEFHLAIDAKTKASDIENILRQFEPFNYKSVVVTKFDETDNAGNIISALSEKGKSISYITNGQNVPVDINRASVVQFLTKLEGLKINREKLDKRFPAGDANQFKWR